MPLSQKSIRSLVLAFSALVAIIELGLVFYFVPAGSLRTVRLSEVYALTALTYLYVTLLASPLYNAFPELAIRRYHVQARRALGVSSFFFAFWHGGITFFKLMGGLDGFLRLNAKYQFLIGCGMLAFFILFLLTCTSLDWAVRKMGRNWKRLHRLVYLAGLVILVHAIFLGFHFQELSAAIPQGIVFAVALLFFLESLRIKKFLSARYPGFGKPAGIFISALIVIGYIFFIIKNN